ncbi:YfhD family protein [Bacillus sp. 1P06AnD]|uniref:YfhD family protein n=1 Tax=Bacillus sp. 1P06AnD TaxID=3132208 RepID=UPI0039A09A34
MFNNQNNEDNDQIMNTAGAFQSDGLDVEFSQELADQDDIVAQKRSKEADHRAKAKKKNNE